MTDVKIRRSVNPNKVRSFNKPAQRRKTPTAPASDANRDLKILGDRGPEVWVVGLKNACFGAIMVNRDVLRKLPIEEAREAIGSGAARLVDKDEANAIIRAKVERSGPERKVEAPKVSVRRSSDHGGEIKAPGESKWDASVTGFATPQEYLSDKRRTKFKALAESLVR